MANSITKLSSSFRIFLAVDAISTIPLLFLFYLGKVGAGQVAILLSLGIPVLYSFGLGVQQARSRDPLPSFTAIDAFILPMKALILSLAVFVYFVVERDKSGTLFSTVFNEGFAISAIIGVTSILGLFFSMLVFVRIHENVSDDKLMNKAAELLHEANNDLLFFCLTPNIGYADATSMGETNRIVVFSKELTNCVARLSQKSGARIRMAYLKPEDFAVFLTEKTAQMDNSKQIHGLNAEDYYTNVSNQIYNCLETHFKGLTSDALSSGRIEKKFT